MTTIRLPHNGWKPRDYQRKAWAYLERGGRHAELIFHRRAGKDEICLHWAAIAAHKRPASYWHMLPMASQARKAIWEAINPHSGKRRIDEAFPQALRETTRENEMLIKFKSGSTWQVVGSDNFNSLVGSPPAGITVSEWALANPAARAYLRPILAENGGWQLYITTPRGKNHAHDTFRAAERDMAAGKDVFAQRLSVYDTGALSAETVAAERAAYQADYGIQAGDALFRQEYLCDFDAAILGAYYGEEMELADSQGRVCEVGYDPSLDVHTAWDLGWSDDLAIWFFQVHRGEIRPDPPRGRGGPPLHAPAHLERQSTAWQDPADVPRRHPDPRTNRARTRRTGRAGRLERGTSHRRSASLVSPHHAARPIQ